MSHSLDPKKPVIRLLACLAIFLTAACGEPVHEAGDPGLRTGYWQATITLPGGDIETGFELSRVDDRYNAALINGQERVPIKEVRWQDGELLLRFPAFNNEIRATLVDGAFVGTVTLVKRFGKEEVLPFRATPGGAGQREETAESPRLDLSGRWAVRFHEPDGSDSPSIGEFAQRGSRIYGTFLNPNADHRYLAGHVRGNRFHLSTFDGAHAFLFAGEVGADGSIVDADFWSGDAWHQTWSAERNDAVVLPDAFSRTWLKPGYERFEFEFPDQDGVPVSSADDKYRGKVVLVTIAGTWCPNCNDEAAFLAPFYRTHRARGLEIVALLFEHFEDFEPAAVQARRFREKLGIEYDTLIAGMSDKADASEALPALNAVLAFPTTIFIDRSGRVRHIHTGFSGPGTGEHYETLTQRFGEIVTGLLDEPENLIESLTEDAAAGAVETPLEERAE